MISSGCSHCPSWSPVSYDVLDWWQCPVAHSTASTLSWHLAWSWGSERNHAHALHAGILHAPACIFSNSRVAWCLWILDSIHSHLTRGVLWCAAWENRFLCIQFLCSSCFASVVELQRMNFFRYLNEKMGKWCLVWIRSVLTFIVLRSVEPSCNSWFLWWITTFCMV